MNRQVNRIDNTFENKTNIFIGFLTAGDPSLCKTEEFIIAMATAGVDLIEIGIPFSDPIAEGEVIQRANIRALNSGTDIEGIFNMVSSVRMKTDIPLVFLTYINPLFVYGYERFFQKCRYCGIDGVIIPDLPFEEKGEIAEFTSKYDIKFITLIAPTSLNSAASPSPDRIKMLAADAEGFVYIVSSMGVTGVREKIQTDLNAIISIVRESAKVKIAVGFGLSTAKQAKEILETADAFIVGSAIVKIIEEYGDAAAAKLYEYAREIRKDRRESSVF